jgi:hypothetical protein
MNIDDLFWTSRLRGFPTSWSFQNKLSKKNMFQKKMSKLSMKHIETMPWNYIILGGTTYKLSSLMFSCPLYRSDL